MQTIKDEINIKGKPVTIDAIRINGFVVIARGTLIKTARINEEWFEDIEDPASLIDKLTNYKQADIFTFWQRPPETKPRYKYYMERIDVAALPIKTFDHWWKEQINAKTRNMIRKGEKKGVVIKLVAFDDELVNGIMSIYNETPVRQGKPFWHYGKDFNTIKKDNATYLNRSIFIGAYHNDDLIGFIKLVCDEKFANTMQIISKIEHRDKAPTNALIAKAVEVCEEKGISYLIYATWSTGSLGDFKRKNGFEKMALPRYYIPLTTKGALALKLNLHHGLRGIVPYKLREIFINLRKKWFSR